MNQPVIVSAARLPSGRLLGTLSPFTAPDLGSFAIKAAIERARVGPEEIDEVIMGHVLQAGCGQNPARQAALKAGLPPKVGALTINKVCGSSLKALVLASQAIKLGDARFIDRVLNVLGDADELAALVGVERHIGRVRFHVPPWTSGFRTRRAS